MGQTYSIIIPILQGRKQSTKMLNDLLKVTCPKIAQVEAELG